MQRTILIVDDDEAMKDNLCDILGDEDYDLLSASTCIDALELSREHKPHVALLDLKLPDGSGVNLLAELKSLNPDCICAMMTAYADLDSAVSALEKGAFHYLQKPVRPTELLRLLEHIFETIQYRDEKRYAEERLRESEKRFRTIFESAQDAIFLKDNSLKYTLVNPGMEKLFKIKAEDFIGRADEDIFGQSEGAQTEKTEVRVLKGEILNEEEIRFVEGKQKMFHSIRVPMSSNSGKITGLCGFARDITETKQLEAQLLQAQKMEAIGTLAGGISHDFNNLLQGILGYSQILLLDKSNGDPDFIKIREIERAARRATELTGQLLAFSRKVDLNPRPVNLNQEIRQVEKLLKRTIPKMIDIELQLDEPLQTVNADPGQLEQVILNIGVNARDAMPEGGRLIIQTKDVFLDNNYCRLNPEANQGPHVLLSIIDTGHGMNQETLEHIFEPFYTTKETGKGTGLGLAMAYGIIKNHEGHITCKSNPGEGTQFNVYLPAIKVDVEDEAENREEPIIMGSGETLLVVEDEEMLRSLAKDMLKRGGYKVIEAKSGEEGLKLYQEKGEEISLIILDLIMPGMGGKQCLAEILKIDSRAKVVVASGYAMSDTEMDDILSASKGFIKKPYYFRNMLKVIREVLDEESN